MSIRKIGAALRCDPTTIRNQLRARGVRIRHTGTDAEKFWDWVDKRGPLECWPWIGAIRNKNGYGSFHIGKHDLRRTLQAHRFAYELAHGPIPDDLEIDHLCRNRRCVNVAHMEVVTHLENMRRMHRAQKIERVGGQRGLDDD